MHLLLLQNNASQFDHKYDLMQFFYFWTEQATLHSLMLNTIFNCNN